MRGRGREERWSIRGDEAALPEPHGRGRPAMEPEPRKQVLFYKIIFVSRGIYENNQIAISNRDPGVMCN